MQVKMRAQSGSYLVGWKDQSYKISGDQFTEIPDDLKDYLSTKLDTMNRCLFEFAPSPATKVEKKVALEDTEVTSENTETQENPEDEKPKVKKVLKTKPEKI